MYAHIWSTQAAASRARVRGYKTQSANGAVAAVAVTTGGGSSRRRRTSGAATPATSAVTAAARMAVVGTRTARQCNVAEGAGEERAPRLAGETDLPAGRLVRPRGPRRGPACRAPRRAARARPPRP